MEQAEIIDTFGTYQQVVEQRVCTVCFDDDVVHVDLYVSSNLLYQAGLHHPLVCGTGVLESKGHCPIEKYVVRGDE